MFFSDDVGVVFEPFSLLHCLLFVLILIGIVLLYVFRDKIANYKHERRIAKSMALFALFWEFSLYAWKLGNGITDWADVLPIGLCAYTLFVGMYSLFFKNKTTFAIGYFWTWGAMASVLFPDIAFSYDRFRFYQFMIGHMFFFFMYIYMIFVYKWYPTWKNLKQSIVVLIGITALMILFSQLTQRNLMFMLNSEGTPFEIFEGGGYLLYLLGVIATAVTMMFIWFLPFWLYHKKHPVIETTPN
ncbi:MAG: TIGR02206 family membrane protein [Bacilli bacterium]|nr:TIGR02206 family membrane protein [Bacilli bacterium]MBN2877208.1 TIGR02206 family membrane protein [Bacilli bacterium]